MVMVSQCDIGTKGIGQFLACQNLCFGSAVEDLPGFHQQHVSKHRHDLLDMVRDQNRGNAKFGCQRILHEIEKSFAGDGIQTSTGFIEDEQFGLCDQCTRDHQALTFSLGEHTPWPFGQVFDAHQIEPTPRLIELLFRNRSPRVQLCLFSGDDHILGELIGLNPLAECHADDTNLFANVVPGSGSEGFTQQHEASGCGLLKAQQHIEQRSFPRSITAEYHPVLTGLHSPVDVVENSDPPLQGDAAELKQHDGVG